VGKSYDLCLNNMKTRGTDDVSPQCLKYRGEPTHNYIELVNDGMSNVLLT